MTTFVLVSLAYIVLIIVACAVHIFIENMDDK